MHHCLTKGNYVWWISSLCINVPHSHHNFAEIGHFSHPCKSFQELQSFLVTVCVLYINSLSIITFCFLSLFRSQLPVECLVTPRYLSHDKLLCGHPVHFHLSIWYQALPWRSWHLVLWTALPPTFPSRRLQDTHGRCAWELQGTHRAVGRPAAEELHPAHQQHRERALRQILFPRWPWRSQHVHLPWLFSAESSG